MKSLKKLFRIGLGPSSSHTIGPSNAAIIFREKTTDAVKYRVILYGSLAATGKGHLTDYTIKTTFSPIECEIIWEKDEELPMHPNGMIFEAYDARGKISDEWTVYSVGDGAIRDLGMENDSEYLYPFNTMTELLKMCEEEGKAFWNYVEDYEGNDIDNYLKKILKVMKKSIDCGIDTKGVLPGGLKLRRKASQYHTKLQKPIYF